MKGMKCLVLVAVTVMAVMFFFAAPVSAGNGPQSVISLDGKHGSSGVNPGMGNSSSGEWSQPENPGAWGGQKPAKAGPKSAEVVLGQLSGFVVLF